MGCYSICPDYDVIKPCVCFYVGEGSVQLYCKNQNLTDSEANDILNAFITSGSSPLRELQMEGNQLTRIPDQLSHFLDSSSALKSLHFGQNEINSVTAGSIHFEQYLDLSWNQLTNLEAGVFQDNYFNGKTIDLRYNYLIRFESEVFQSVLQ